MQRGYARAEERNERARAQLTPLGPGERPRPLVVASAVAALLAVSNLGFWVAGVEIRGQQPGAFGVILFAALMLAAAVGMWQRRYWAVLGFQAMLGISIAISALGLLLASNLAAVALCLAIIGAGGWLFWKLVRVMGRIQTPQRVR
ncbi:MAG: hypothetical protein QOI62_96 [Solirubrobacteraceae bacterium]|jgi:hypothetical protein|nr:hypothetical protein [Solirubrobacteraceae bacterium]MEA2356836.1 hypothetical protein [Solirubrobacteraceae bacterium]